jgi:multiple sugar transport system substrate-binding protein
MIGGTGVAVTVSCAHRRRGGCLRQMARQHRTPAGSYFREGGQPASLAAWTDPAIDAEANGFFSRTLDTFESAYMRPRFDGFVPSLNRRESKSIAACAAI